MESLDKWWSIYFSFLEFLSILNIEYRREQFKVKGDEKMEMGQLGSHATLPSSFLFFLTFFTLHRHLLSECLEEAISIFTCLPLLILTRKRGRNTRVHLMVRTGSSASLKMMYIIMSRNVSWKKKIVSERSRFLHAWK